MASATWLLNTQTRLRNKTDFSDYNCQWPIFHGWLNILNLHSVKQIFWVITGDRFTAGTTWLGGRTLTIAANEIFLYYIGMLFWSEAARRVRSSLKACNNFLHDLKTNTKINKKV